jgi:hypothetical protein
MVTTKVLRRASDTRQRLARKLAYAAWLLPAVLGYVLGWAWWLTLAALVPGLAWYVCVEGRSYYAESRDADPAAPLGRHLPILRLIPVLIPVFLLRGRFAGVIVVVALIAVDQWPMRRDHVKSQVTGAMRSRERRVRQTRARQPPRLRRERR